MRDRAIRELERAALADPEALERAQAVAASRRAGRQLENFDLALEVWLEGAQAIVDAVYKEGHRPKLELERRRRYARIVARFNYGGGSVWAFIDLKGGKVKGAPSKAGDIYKPADYRAPAKWSRGNIFDETGGLGCLTAYGPKYLG